MRGVISLLTYMILCWLEIGWWLNML